MVMLHFIALSCLFIEQAYQGHAGCKQHINDMCLTKTDFV